MVWPGFLQPNFIETGEAAWISADTCSFFALVMLVWGGTLSRLLESEEAQQEQVGWV